MAMSSAERSRRWRQRHPESDKERNARWRAANPYMAREHYWRAQGIHLTYTEYEQMVMDQGGRCGICHQLFSGTPHVDHNHETGRVRGLLCRNCNVGIGLFRDDPLLLTVASKWVS